MGMRSRNKKLAAVAEKKNKVKRDAKKVKRDTKGMTAGQKLHAKMHGQK